MAKHFLRVVAAVLSVGWLVPAWISFQFLLGFLRKFDKEDPAAPSSFSHLDVAGTYFSLAVIWLAVVIVGWALYATRAAKK